MTVKSKRNLFAALALGMALLIAIAVSARLDQGSAGSKAAPAFELKRSDGTVFSLASLRGHPVVLHFWAAWCPPCLDELPDWLGAAQKLEGSAVRFVAVSLDPTWADARKVIPEGRLPAGVVSVLDPEQKTAGDFGSYQFPETYLIDPELRVVHKWVGPQDWSNPNLIEAIRRLSGAAK